jgi:hypothetical protein
MNYSIEILEKEKHLLNSCLTSWDLKHYPESRKDRQKRVDDIELCIRVLKMVNDGINPFSTHNVYGINLLKDKQL